MLPQILATVQVGFPPAERPKAYGAYGAMNGLGAAAAPIIGGLLAGNDVLGLGWRSVFWINVPVGLAALVAGAVLVAESRSARRPRLDLLGVVIVSAGLLLLLYPLIQGGEHGWPGWSFAMMAAAVLVLAAFAWHQARRERRGFPLVPASLFRLRSFVSGLLVTVVAFSTISAVFLVLTVQLQAGHGLSALKAGLTFMAWPVGLATTSTLAVRLAPALGRRLISAGTLTLAAAMVVTIAMIHAAVAVIGAIFTTLLERGRGIDAAASTALWYPAAAFALAFAFSFALPPGPGRPRTRFPPSPDRTEGSTPCQLEPQCSSSAAAWSG